MNLQYTPKRELCIIGFITLIGAHLIFSIYCSYTNSFYQKRYIGISQQVTHATEQIYNFEYTETKSYDTLSSALVDIELDAEFLHDSLRQAQLIPFQSYALIHAEAVNKAKHINSELQEYTRAINAILTAKVSYEYALTTITNTQNLLLDKYAAPAEQLAVMASIYQAAANIQVPDMLNRDLMFKNLLSYISLRDRVGAAIQEEQSKLTEAHIQVKLDALNNYWIEQSSKSKIEATISALCLLLALGSYFFWRQWNNYRQATLYQNELLDIEHERAKLSLALEYAQDTIIITDKEGLTTWVNKGFEALTGYSFDEALGIKPGDLLQGKGTDQKEKQRISECLQQSRSIQTELLNYHKDGTPYWIDMIITPIVDAQGHTVNFIAVERDVTKRRELEQNLALSVEQAESSNKAKSTFLATMSHELRTPLNGIMGMAQILESSTEDETQREQLCILLESGDHLLSLLNDILDFSKIEQNKLELEAIPFQFDDIISPVLSTYKALCADKGIELVIENSIPKERSFRGDKARIRQVIFNLLSNAVKFTPQGSISLNFDEIASSSSPETVLNVSKQSRSTISIVIKDSGVGISQDRLEHIFDPFVQAESSTTREFGGTGLGLAIVKQLVLLMDGRVSVQSEAGVGTTFFIDIELEVTTQRAHPQQAKHSLSCQAISQALSILIVEDNPINAVVTKTFCQKQGHKVSLAENGLVAIEILKNERFDLIIMDNHMPEMDGITATKVIRDEMKLNTVIFGCTADVFKEARDNFISAGANYVLTKPLQKESFFDALQQYQEQLISNATPCPAVGSD
ncbi:ATP-binding protein [Photobacterium alginatilyticum]|uniref:histidine kinase n=1 Tax=Photobacterium alginatilyticum TaxID=1775171 RepID=A0ABW9YAT4_9GAMM|nr:ATP-binding protein [Photobacterium alginatilyticum]NBI50963.1 response regulator [Photobacterium alginatilyticum]